MLSNKVSRYDFILIWGNGLQYKKDILDIIERTSNLDILKILSHKPKSLKKFVKEVYSYDYAPFQHLKAKTNLAKLWQSVHHAIKQLQTKKELLLLIAQNVAN